MPAQPLKLSSEFTAVLDALEKEERSLFVTGRAGTGKSTLLQLFRNTTRKRVAVLAPTGIAALNVQGQTIHSFFSFPPRLVQGQDIRKRRNRRLYKNLDLLIIDEISMVRADMIDAMDSFLRLNREDERPFGGLQLAVFGDLFQLPPVVASEAERQFLALQYDSPYFFSANAWENFPLELWELRKVYRQENRRFLRLLDEVRLNQADADTLAAFNSRCQPHFQPEEFYITLAARNATADAINRKALNAIPLPARRYTATVTGRFSPSAYPTDPALALKLDAQVMFLKNDPEGQFVNGTLGKVVKLEDEQVTVLVEEQGKRRYVEAEPMSWDILRYKASGHDPKSLETEVVGSFRQLPLKLAWAVTIHKAQGKTFDKVIIDLDRGAFEHGQTYVALSRCRSLEGIVLRKPLRPQDIITDPAIVGYYLQQR